MSRETREYRKRLGFNRQVDCKTYLRAKDIQILNYELIAARVERSIQIFEQFNQNLVVPWGGDVRAFAMDTYKTILDNKIIPRLRNHGRSPEDVFNAWYNSYLGEKIVQPFLCREFQVSSFERMGGDDITNPETFSRNALPDLYNAEKFLAVEVQFATGDTDGHIKKSKVTQALGGAFAGSFVAFFNLMTGNYALIDLMDLENAEFKPNPQFEGTLCYTVPDEEWLPFWCETL